MTLSFFDQSEVKAFIAKAYAQEEFTTKSADIRQIKKLFLASKEGQTWLDFAIEKDPALQGKPLQEVKQEVLCYPGLTALATYMVAHQIYQQHRFADARHLAEAAHTLSGMDIHPGASIHPKVFFDHCTGMVIGETASVGEGAMFYHGVTLGGVGGKSQQVIDAVTQETKLARHPQVGKNVTISLNAQILGPSTIGEGTRIGPKAQIMNTELAANSMVGPNVELNNMHDLPENCYFTVEGQNIAINHNKAPQTMVEKVRDWGRATLLTPDKLSVA